MATAVGHMTPTKWNHLTATYTERRVKNAVKQSILLLNVGVGKIINQDKDVRLIEDDVDEEVYSTPKIYIRGQSR